MEPQSCEGCRKGGLGCKYTYITTYPLADYK